MATRLNDRSWGTWLAEPLRGWRLAAVVLAVWTAGAAYCHGYERLLTGIDEWPGSFLWSAVAVLPWLALFEWSKSRTGARLLSSPVRLFVALLLTGAASMLVEIVANRLTGGWAAPLGLDAMRRLPAIGASLLLILWTQALRRSSTSGEASGPATADLRELAPSIDWIAAADNYVELHIGERVLLRRMTLRAAERELERLGFVRIHRRFLVKRARVDAIIGTNGDRRVQVGAAQLPVGRSYAARLTS